MREIINSSETGFNHNCHWFFMIAKLILNIPFSNILHVLIEFHHIEVSGVCEVNN